MGTPKAAFQFFSANSDDGSVSRIYFLKCAETIGFPGRADWVFETLQDGTERISRKSFAKGMCAAGTKHWSQERFDFMVLVTAAATMSRGIAAPTSHTSRSLSGTGETNCLTSTLAQQCAIQGGAVEPGVVNRKDEGNRDNRLAARRRKNDSGENSTDVGGEVVRPRC